MNNITTYLPEQWRSLLAAEFNKPYFKELTSFIESEYNEQTIYPPREQIFRAFDLCLPTEVKVVIIGQDPYHGPLQANGLAFSVADGVKHPPSLVNIFKEVESEGFSTRGESGDLERWAEQGVLLINSTLTVRAHQAASHSGKGWEKFTDAVIEAVDREQQGVVYMLWGAHAQRKASFVDREKNLVLNSVHPSPLAAYRGWFGSGDFRKACDYLASTGKEPIRW